MGAKGGVEAWLRREGPLDAEAHSEARRGLDLAAGRRSLLSEGSRPCLQLEAAAAYQLTIIPLYQRAFPSLPFPARRPPSFFSRQPTSATGYRWMIPVARHLIDLTLRKKHKLTSTASRWALELAIPARA